MEGISKELRYSDTDPCGVLYCIKDNDTYAFTNPIIVVVVGRYMEKILKMMQWDGNFQSCKNKVIAEMKNMISNFDEYR